MKDTSFSCLTILILCFLLLPFTKGKAQQFQAGVIAGANLSELAGDDISSYVGWNTGLVAKVKIRERWRLSTEFLFSQAGEYVLPDYYPPANYGRIRLNYLEVPISFSWLAFKETNYFQKHFSFGLTYARLIDYAAEDVTGVVLTEQIIWNKKNAILGHFGVAHYFSPPLGLDFRASLAKNIQTWTWTLSLRMVYLFGEKV